MEPHAKCDILYTSSKGNVEANPLCTVTTPFCVGVPVKRQQPVGVFIEFLYKFVLPYLTFPSDSCVNIINI